MALRIPVIYGSVRGDRQGIRAARYLMAQLAERGHAPTLVDPLVDTLPLLDRMYKRLSLNDGGTGVGWPR